ncbi:MAG: DUF59 domain-containing protein [Rhizobiales bacterium]|nr:DUF59 domain-containing protein [Hyphomicrobiales bacterium]
MHVLDTIHDPCSAAIGKPIGLVGMGIIDDVSVAGDEISVTVLPTFPDCLFRGVFEEKIEKALGGLPWCRHVTVRFRAADHGWDETRMTPEARAQLGRRRVISTGDCAA